MKLKRRGFIKRAVATCVTAAGAFGADVTSAASTTQTAARHTAVKSVGEVEVKDVPG